MLYLCRPTIRARQDEVDEERVAIQNRWMMDLSRGPARLYSPWTLAPHGSVVGVHGFSKEDQHIIEQFAQLPSLG